MTAFVEYNPTMATASMTMASHSVDHNHSVTSSSIDHHVESREELIEKLKVNLVRYARSNDRRMVLRTLKEVSFLSYIPLEAPTIRSDISMSELEKEVSMERVVLNDTLLCPPDPTQTSFQSAGTNFGCPIILKGLAKTLCENSTLNEKTLYERVLFRLANSSASADVFDQLNSMMGSTELIVKKISSDSTVKNKTNNVGEPIDLKLYNTGGQIHMALQSTFTFGLFRKNDVVSNRAWIVLKCKIRERANLCTNDSFRSLNVKTPNLY